MTSAMGIKKTLKHLRQLAEVSQQNQETAHNMLYRIEQELSPPTIASAMKAMGQSFSGAFGSSGKVPPYPKTMYTMVKDIYERAGNGFNLSHEPAVIKLTEASADILGAVREVRNRLHDHTQTTDRKLNGINNTLTRLADKLQSYEPTKDDVRERDSLTNGVAKLRADVATILNRQERVADTVGTTLKQIRGDLSGVYINQESQSRQIDALQNQLAELRAEHHAAATAGEPVKVYASKGTTEMLAHIQQRLELVAATVSDIRTESAGNHDTARAELYKITERLMTLTTKVDAQSKANMEALAEIKRKHSKEYQELYSLIYGQMPDMATAPETRAIRARMDTLEEKVSQLADHLSNVDDRLVQASLIDGGIAGR